MAWEQHEDFENLNINGFRTFSNDIVYVQCVKSPAYMISEEEEREHYASQAIEAGGPPEWSQQSAVDTWRQQWEHASAPVRKEEVFCLDV